MDRVFRVPFDYYASPRRLTSFTIPVEHQLAILEGQLELAVELGRNVSMHSVKSQQVTVELLARMKKRFGERWNRISVDMHSCGLSPQTWKDVEVGFRRVLIVFGSNANKFAAVFRGSTKMFSSPCPLSSTTTTAALET